MTISDQDLLCAQEAHPAPCSPGLASLLEQASRFVQASKSSNTTRAYKADWKHFEAWCFGHELMALPAAPETLALYLTALADSHKVSTLQRRFSAISQAHQLAGHPSPTLDAKVRTTFSGIRRTLGSAQVGKLPVLLEDLRIMLQSLGESLLAQRDRALLLLGFAGAFRRSELVSLDVAELEFQRLVMIVTIRRSKTDQEQQGRRIGIPLGAHLETCPVRALKNWLAVAKISHGPIFRGVNRHGQVSLRRLSDQTVARVVKRTVKAMGLDPRGYAGHSLRAGLATSAAAAGASERSIMNQTGHRSLTIVRRYIREADLLGRGNAVAAVGL